MPLNRRFAKKSEEKGSHLKLKGLQKGLVSVGISHYLFLSMFIVYDLSSTAAGLLLAGGSRGCC